MEKEVQTEGTRQPMKTQQGYSAELMGQLIQIDRMGSLAKFQEKVNRILRLIGNCIGAERVYMFERTEGEEETYSNTYEWCAPGITPQIQELQKLTLADMPQWIPRFKRGETIEIPDLEMVRETMPREYEILKLQDIYAEVAAPICYRDRLLGFIGIDNPPGKVSKLFLQQLRFVGVHLSSVQENLQMVSLLENNLHMMEQEKEILRVLCEDCSSVYRVNLRDDTAEVIKLEQYANASRMIASMDGTKVSYSRQMRQYYEKFIFAESAPDYLEVFSAENLMRELSVQERICRRFKSKPNDKGEEYFEIRATKLTEGEDSFLVLIDFRHVDEIVREERLHQREIEAALAETQKNNEILSAISKIYFLIYRIDLTTDYFEEVSGRSERHSLTWERGSASQQMRQLSEKFVEKEYRESVMQFLDLSTLPKRLASEESTAVEYLAADGNWHLARFIVQKRCGTGRVEHVLCVIRLISEEKRREKYWIVEAEEAKRANDAKSEFLSRMSHDIRTPMNVIMGFVNIARQHLDDPEKMRECLDRIQMSGENLQQLIDDVLDISRIESGRLQITPQPLRISEFCDFYRQTIQGMAQEKGIRFVCCHPHVPQDIVWADSMHLGQIYMNLLSNAIKYTPQGGKVGLEVYEEASPKRGCVRLITQVQDTGIGMTPEFMKEMYSEFTRAIDTRVNKVRGSGLGLAIVKRLVDKMGGTIEAESQFRAGTTFKVTLDLPIASEADLRSEKEPQAPLQLPNRVITLLVAEDNDLN